MKTICKIPASIYAVNQGADMYAAAGIASAYDEIIVDYKSFADTQVTRHMHNLIEIMAQPVWIGLQTVWSEDDELDPEIAYSQFANRIIGELDTLWDDFVATGRTSLVKGFTVDLDYSRQFGNVTSTSQLPRYIDRDVINAIVGAIHGYNRPAMVITKRVIDALGLVYRGGDTTTPGRAAWPTVLGTVNALSDWIVARDSLMSPLFRNGYQSPVSSNAFLLAENLSVLKVREATNLNVGLLQHVNFNMVSPDYHLGHSYSPAMRDHIRGYMTFCALIGVTGAGILPLTNPGVPTLANIGSIRPYTFTARDGDYRMHSVNGKYVIDYVVNSKLSRMTFSNDFREVTLDGTALKA